jgi:hypothetical protein
VRRNSPRHEWCRGRDIHDGASPRLWPAPGVFDVPRSDRRAAEVEAEDGQTLGQVADATSGKSSSGLVDYLSSLVKMRLDKLVTAQRITSAQESTFLTGVQSKLTKLVAMNWTDRARMDWHH